MATISIRSRIEGAFFGLAAGDAFGAPYEGGPLERLVWLAIGKTRDGKRRWTDDTQMSLDVARSLIEFRKIDQDDLAKRFSTSYRWSRGYGRGAAKVLKRIRRGMNWRTACRSVFPDGSYGNGAAMRAPIIGLYFHQQIDQLDEASCQAAEITHAHPLAIDGARLIAHTIAGACNGWHPQEIWNWLLSLECETAFKNRLELASKWATSNRQVTPAELSTRMGNGIAATNSVITGIFIGLANADRTFEQLLDLAISVGGDTDTISAMAGSIWGALHGIEELSIDHQANIENEALIRKTAIDLYNSTQ